MNDKPTMRRSVSIHDRSHFDNTLRAQIQIALHQRKVSQEQWQAAIEKAQMRAERTYQKHLGGTSKYMPHQGEQECARRKRQLAAGQIYNHTGIS